MRGDPAPVHFSFGWEPRRFHARGGMMWAYTHIGHKHIITSDKGIGASV